MERVQTGVEHGGLAYFEHKAEALLPSENAVVARNRAITATYAELYLRERRLFKWAGMAAFASHRVGISLVPFEVAEWVDGGARFVRREDPGLRARDLDDDLNLLRETNNRVYRSIAWAHLAFEELRDDGARVLDLTQGRAEWKLLRSGWEKLGKASRKLRQGEPQPAVLPEIWRANRELLRFEQEVTVQSGFDRMERAFTAFLTWAMSMEFDGDHSELELDTFSYFPLHMWTAGLKVLAKTRSLPRVDRFDHRWHWVDRRLFPLFQHIDAKDAALERKLARLAALKDPSLSLERRALTRARQRGL